MAITKEKVKIQAESIAFGVGLALNSGNFLGISNMINWAKKDSALLFMVITDTEGEELTSYNPQKLKTTVNNTFEQENFILLGDQLYAQVPITYLNEKYGKLLVCYSLEETFCNIHQNSITTVYIILCILLGGVLIALIFSNFISKSLIELKIVANNIAKGKRDLAVNVDSTDEVGELGNAVNEMLNALIKSEQEIKAKTDELARSNKELTDFSYVVSHDLKAPLRAIFTLSNFLEEDLHSKLDEETENNFRLLKSRVSRMQDLINGILEYSRVGRRDTILALIDLQQTVQEVIEVVHPDSNFSIFIPDNLPTIKYNKVRIYQVFQNIISNAIMHNDVGKGRIELAVQENNSFYTFTIKDDGPGIAPRDQEKIFGIFQTLKSKDELESTGVGLTIVRKIIEDRGGEIRVKSDLGEGAAFIFTIPKD